jgi:hypothetical protein
MNKEELARELYGKIVNQDFIPDIITVERIAEYLLNHYHLIKKEGTRGIEGELRFDNEEFYLGDVAIEELAGKYARIFIEGEKCE